MAEEGPPQARSWLEARFRCTIPPVRHLGLLVAALLVGCSPDRGPVREWAPADHDQEIGPSRTQVTQKTMTDEEDARSLAETAWQRDCTKCHGPDGHGDGPQGPMVQAPDITKADLIDKLSDDDIAKLIKEGKNKMPAFPSLPDRVIKGLVGRVRAGAAR